MLACVRFSHLDNKLGVVSVTTLSSALTPEMFASLESAETSQEMSRAHPVNAGTGTSTTLEAVLSVAALASVSADTLTPAALRTTASADIRLEYKQLRAAQLLQRSPPSLASLLLHPLPPLSSPPSARVGRKSKFCLHQHNPLGGRC